MNNGTLYGQVGVHSTSNRGIPARHRLVLRAAAFAAAHLQTDRAAPPSGLRIARRSADRESREPDDGLNHQRRQRGEARHRRMESLSALEGAGGAPPGSAPAKELAGLRSRGDSYDAGLFTPGHAAFKSGHNDAFVGLALRLGGGEDGGGEGPSRLGGGRSAGRRRRRRPVFYLDGPDGATTSALLAAGFDRDDELYSANEWEASAESLRSPPFLLCPGNCLSGRAQDVLRSDQALRDAPFVAAYLDGCGGDPAPVIDMVRALFDGALAPEVAIGFTLTAAEPTGRDLIDRVQDVTRATMAAAGGRGYDMRHVGDNPGRFGVDPDLLRRHEGTTTCWLVCSKRGDGRGCATME